MDTPGNSTHPTARDDDDAAGCASWWWALILLAALIGIWLAWTSFSARKGTGGPILPGPTNPTPR